MPPTKAIDSSSIELKALRTTIYNCTWNEINTDSPNKKMPKVQNANNPSKFGMKTYYPITTAVITMNHGPRVPNPLIKSSSASKQIYHPRVVCGRGGGAYHATTDEKTAIISLRFNRVIQKPTTRSNLTSNLQITPIPPPSPSPLPLHNHHKQLPLAQKYI